MKPYRKVSVNALASGSLCLLLAAVLSAGCKKEEITVYRVPKNPVPMAAATPPDREASMETMAAPPRITWKLPAGWKEQAASGMSAASFLIPGEGDKKAELSVMTFPGAGAGELNLVNIVRERAKLPPLGQEELAKLMERVDVGGVNGSLIDLTGAATSGVNTNNDTPPNRILVAVVPHDGITWFFKMAGDTDVVTAQKPALVYFLKSVAFGATDAGTPAVASQPAPVVANDTASALGKPSWTVPAGWQEVPPSQMLLAKFVAKSADGQAEITVSSFGGSVGGVLANVNRWRGQIGLAPVGQEELDKTLGSIDVQGGKAMLVDVSGKSPKTGKETRIAGVIWPRDGSTWFYKLMGDSAAVGREKEAFVKFVQTARYGNEP